MGLISFNEQQQRRKNREGDKAGSACTAGLYESPGS